MDSKKVNISSNHGSKVEPSTSKYMANIKNSKFFLNENGDFYSSNEYVKYSNSNIYENGKVFYFLKLIYSLGSIF